MTLEKRNIQKLKTILDFTKIINTSTDLDYILNLFMNKTLELLDRADIGVIFLYDKKRDMLDLKTAVGFGNINISLKPGESITGIAFNKKKTIHFKNHHEINQAMATMRNKNYSRLEKKIDQSMNNLQSSISCPLMYKDDCIGVLVIDNYYGKDPLNEDDIYLVELIANNATIAISNALNYKKIISNQQSLEKYSQMIEEEKNKFQYSTFLHDKFTEMVLNGSSINDIVNEVSNLLEHDVFILDLFHKMTQSNFNYHITKEFLIKHKRIITRTLDQYKSLQQFTIKNYNVFINPITVNNQIHGWVGVVLSKNALDKFEKISIDKSSTIIALEMLKNNEIMNLQESLKGDFFENLLKNKTSKFMDNFCKKYNYNKNSSHQLIIIKLNYQNINSKLYNKIKYLYGKINKLMKKNFTNSVSLLKNNYVITIFNKTFETNRSFLELLAKKIKEKIDFFLPFLDIEINYQIIISEEIKNNKNFGFTYNNAMNLFNIKFIKNNNDVIYFYEDFEIKKFLLSNSQEELRQFVHKTLGNLINYNHASKNDLFETLITYIKTDKEWKQTKNKLHIHGNTLTYRLKRLQSLLQLDFSNYYDLLKLKFSLEILELYPELKNNG